MYDTLLTSLSFSKIGYTALHCAAGSGHSDVVRLLLSNGARIEAVDEVIYFLHMTYQSIMYCNIIWVHNFII